MKVNNITELVGNTPHIRLSKLFPKHEVWLKAEFINPGGSIKDRIALAMIEDAERSGHLNPEGTIIEPTSGNTGIGLAMVAAYKGYKIILVMPDSMSVERREILKAYGAELILTPRGAGMKGAIEKAKELLKNTNNSFMPCQFENMANPASHAMFTAREVLNDFDVGFDFLISGIGTGGHISGVGRVLKQKFPNLKVVGVEPAESAVISGSEPSPHAIQGIGAGFIPKTLSIELLDEIVTVESHEAFDMMRKLSVSEGILAGISTGASIAAVRKRLNDEKESRRVLTFAYDTGERYLSVNKPIAKD